MIEHVVRYLDFKASLATATPSRLGEQPYVRKGDLFQHSRGDVGSSNDGCQRLWWSFERHRFDRPRHQAYRGIYDRSVSLSQRS